MMDDGLLKEGLKELKLLSDRNLSILNKYIEEIERFNSAYGLVKVKDRRELIIKHILDSLAPFDIINKLLDYSTSGSVADVGSGAGLPGIPLAICKHDAEFTLIERMGRRAGFLLNTVAALGLSNVHIEEKEMEKAAGESYDLLVFRAYKPIDKKILKGLFRLLKPNGILAAYKGRRISAEEEINALSCDWELVPVSVPFLKDERHLLIIKQTKQS